MSCGRRNSVNMSFLPVAPGRMSAGFLQRIAIYSLAAASEVTEVTDAVLSFA